ncbi:helix-turn-helix transcriptional regulator [Yinghuangia sp. ASG 101]|uniref:helix-turn-helix domain-containing protein n=1 Tax=Yinghuangia sp. ASG 101 TaxID=2896848 RepID=UPI001E401308|nr:helix-turn-helix transcriptional regulator [Yinghuangia sp. ASG 101]UGQ13011.1 helix-turn-helix transcriptional regulator [Yinghuangia sp. ASG 101]
MERGDSVEKLPPWAVLLAKLRESRGMRPTDAEKRVGLRSYREYEKGRRPLAAESLRQIIADLGLTRSEATALAGAARLPLPPLPCRDVPENLQELIAYVKSKPSPTYVCGPAGDIIVSNTAAGVWISPLLAPEHEGGVRHNAVVMQVVEAPRHMIPPDAMGGYLEQIMAHYKAVMFRHWDHEECRPIFDEVVAYLSDLHPVWRERWHDVAARERPTGAGRFVMAALWDDDPAHPWHDPDHVQHYHVHTMVADPYVASTRTDYRVVDINPVPIEGGVSMEVTGRFARTRTAWWLPEAGPGAASRRADLGMARRGRRRRR